MKSDRAFSRESSCELDVRSMVMSYKFVLMYSNLLLILFAHIFLSSRRFVVVFFFFFTRVFKNCCHIPLLPEARNSHRVKDNCCVLKGTFNGYILGRAGCFA